MSDQEEIQNPKTGNPGARPDGAQDEAAAAAAVQQMFDSIAPRYDLLNHVLSANIDRYWWWRAARSFDAVLRRPEAEILDICCGTGDMTLALLKRRPSGSQPITAGDFSRGMLSRGALKFGKPGVGARKPGQPYAEPLEADGLHLPFAGEHLDLVVSAFGFRNLANYLAGLKEFHRVMKPGASLGILDFSEPGGVLGKFYAFYFRNVLPAIGRAICGQEGPYSYLPKSVGNFPPPERMLELMREAGFVDCKWQPYTFGIAGLWSARKP